jgi:hypothetical protein
MMMKKHTWTPSQSVSKREERDEIIHVLYSSGFSSDDNECNFIK